MNIRPEVIDALKSERRYQEQKWPGHKHTAAEYILIMEKCLADARKAWVTQKGEIAALHEIRQVTAVGIAAMEQLAHHTAANPSQTDL